MTDMPDAALDRNLANLRNSFDLLLRAQHFGKTGYVISDVLRDRVYWSDSLFAQRKVPRREYFTRVEALEFIHPDDLGMFIQTRDRALAAREEFELEMRVLCGDGSVIWENGLAQPLFDADGNYAGLLTVVRDVTESKNATASLLEQEATYRTLFNGIGDSIFLLLDDRFIDCNEAALSMFGCAREQLVGQSPVRFSPELQADRRPSAERAREMISGALLGKRQFFEWRHKRFDGGEFDAEVTLTRVAASGQPLLFGVVRDITERKVGELALKASRDKFAGAFNASVDAMVVVSLGELPGASVILDANKAAEKIFGRTVDGVVGRTISEAGLVADMTVLSELRSQLASDNNVHEFPIKLRRHDGVLMDVEINGSVFHAGGERLSLIVVRDVTEQKAAEDKIQELNVSLETSLRQLRAIADNILVAISYQDAEGRLRFVNRTLGTWFGMPHSEMIGKRVQDMVSQSYLDAVESIRARRETGEHRFEATLPYPDGQTRAVEISYVPDRTADGTLLGYFTLAIDMTDRKAAEEQLRQSQKLQAIGKLTGGVAHDFNNLLAVVSGNLELANEALGGGNDHVRNLLEPARRAAERGSTLTRSLLSFARQQPLSPAVTDLNALVRDTTELLRRTLPANIRIEFSGAAGLWPCEVDPGQLQNALLNLVVNSRDAMPDGGRLMIETRNVRIKEEDAVASSELTPGQYVQLAVSDTGMGMPMNVVARAFEPFYTTKEVGQGTGLGLSMVYGFVMQSGGHITIDSKVGSGTTVKAYLPRWVGSAEQSSSHAVHDAPLSQREVVLVVEDDGDMRFVVVTMLRSLGYDVREASSGPKALDALDAQPEIALLLTDVMLSGSMNGRRLAEEARSRRPDIRVLYMSGYTEDAITHQGRLDPGVHYIQKPFRKLDLAAKILEALDKA